jgi:hypothetical protein
MVAEPKFKHLLICLKIKLRILNKCLRSITKQTKYQSTFKNPFHYLSSFFRNLYFVL